MTTQLSATEESATGIPIVDFEGSYSDDPARRRQSAAALRAALESLGFCYLRNHGVPTSVIDALFAQSRAFFVLPLEVKQTTTRPERGRNRGYGGLAFQALDENRPGDLKETFHAGDESTGRNLWLEDAPSFRQAVVAFHQAASQTCSQLMRAIALSLGLAEDYFDPFYDHADHWLRLLHYPPLQGPPLRGQLRAGAHTDYGGVSLLFQDDEGGLEIQGPDGTWIAAPSLSGAAVVNTGDLIERWTNGMFRSSPHRVRNPEGPAAARDRYSTVLFHGPNDDAVISCLESCQSQDRPPMYPPITAFEHIRARVMASHSQGY